MRRTEIVTPALGEAGNGQIGQNRQKDGSNANGKGNDKGKERASGDGEEEAAAVEEIGSPDWPEEPAEEDEENEEREPAPEPRAPPLPTERVPSRSPGLSPEPRPPEGDSAAWRDPLDDDDEEEDEQPAAKRARV
jgi:hypothetical protein